MIKPKAADAARSLDELEPISATALARRPLTREAARARRTPLARLSPEEQLVLLHDGRGLKQLLPMAVKTAQLDPWADRGLHRGDLLMAVLHAPERLRPPGSALNRSIVALAKAALKAASKLPMARRQPDLEADIQKCMERWQHWPNG